MKRTQRKHRAIMAADAIIALAVVAILATALLVAVNRQNLASQRLAEQRACTRLAEITLLSLQTGEKAPSPPADAKVTVQKIEVKDDVPTGLTWASVKVTRGSHTAELNGLVKADAVKETP